MSTEKRLFIVRHGHRDKPFGRGYDNGLSKKGKKQAKKLSAYLAKRLKDEDPILISSPKLRCVETLEPLANRLGKEVKNSDELLEKREEAATESEAQFRIRIREFLEKTAEEKGKTLIACSHGDWIPAALAHLTGLELELKKGGLVEIAFSGKKPKLVNLIQQLP